MVREGYGGWRVWGRDIGRVWGRDTGRVRVRFAQLGLDMEYRS